MTLFATFAAAAALLAAPGSISASPQPGLRSHVAFEESSPLESTAEILRRVLPPLTAARLRQTDLPGYPVDPKEESFTVYVPAHKPPGGYALLVFVPPWNDAPIPTGWEPVFDRYGVIFASALNSGNDQHVQFRRMPLALLAAYNVAKQYAVAPERVFVAGFSGGSRVALRLALAYPDVFRGALLNSGADPIGRPAMPLPPADLFQRFQTATRLYFISGDRDLATRNIEAASLLSMRAWCVAGVHSTKMWNTGHAPVNPAVLLAALDAFLDPTPPNAASLADCRARVQSELTSSLQHVESLIAAGDKGSAQNALNDLDAKYGNLAAPQILALQRRL